MNSRFVRHRCRTSAGIDTCPPFEMVACFMSDTVDHETALSSMSTLSNHAEVFGRPGNLPAVRERPGAWRESRSQPPAADPEKGKPRRRPLPAGPTGGRCEHHGAARQTQLGRACHAEQTAPSTTPMQTLMVVRIGPGVN